MVDTFHGKTENFTVMNLVEVAGWKFYLWSSYASLLHNTKQPQNNYTCRIHTKKLFIENTVMWLTGGSGIGFLQFEQW